MPPLTPTTGSPPEWRGMPFYNPTPAPPRPRPEPPRATVPYRLAAFGVRWICQTSAYICITAALYILATGQI